MDVLKQLLLFEDNFSAFLVERLFINRKIKNQITKYGERKMKERIVKCVIPRFSTMYC